MAKVICIMGESGSGKTTSCRNLDPTTTYYIDADRKGLSWKGWRKQYNTENKNYLCVDDPKTINGYMTAISEKCPKIKDSTASRALFLFVGEPASRAGRGKILPFG